MAEVAASDRVAEVAAAMADPQARTQAYLDEHKIQEKLNELLLGVVVELPDDPFTWMADRLMEGCLLYTSPSPRDS